MKTYIIHVSTAIDREKHMQAQVAGKSLEPVFINEGDMKDLSSEVLDKYFTGVEMKRVMAWTSCAYKHFLAYEQIVQANLPIALIFEDDIILSSDFEAVVQKVLQEVEREKMHNFIISLEDSGLRFVKRSERAKHNHRLTYQRRHMRGTGAYLIDLEASQNMLQIVTTEKCHRPIDCFMEACASIDKINIFWTHPTVASQGSYFGSIAPLIGYRPVGKMRIWGVKLKRWYKKMMANIK
jgi:glycosyl transferase family 25